jgi:hypothetical protein
MVTKRIGKEKERDDVKIQVRAIELVGLIHEFLSFYGLEPWDRANKFFVEKYHKDEAQTPRETVDFLAMLAAFMPGYWHKELIERFLFVYRQKYGDYDEYDDNETDNETF